MERLKFSWTILSETAVCWICVQLLFLGSQFNSVFTSVTPKTTPILKYLIKIDWVFFYNYIFNTHTFNPWCRTQWAAVKTYLFVMRLPPHPKCLSPFEIFLCSIMTAHGWSPGRASFPLYILSVMKDPQYLGRRSSGICAKISFRFQIWTVKWVKLLIWTLK